MKNFEIFLHGKNDNPELCEDGFIVKEKFAAVIDGVTSKSDKRFGGNKSGRMAMEIITNSLQNDVEKLDAFELFSELSSQIRKFHSVFKVSLPEDKLRASIIVYNEIFHEVWGYGDCQCMIADISYLHKKKIDQVNSEKRAEILINEINNGVSLEYIQNNDIGRKAILDDLKKQFEYENKLGDFGYPVINGDNIIPEMIVKYKVNPGEKIILATDGYPILCETLRESEIELQRLIKEDPLCIYENRSTKGLKLGNNSFDDRCYCGFFAE